jgi:AbrB family looped-hinge helix DNA binding protein
MKQSHTETGKIGKKGVFTIPASLRKRFGLHDGSLVIAEERADGILLRPAMATVIEMYDDRRRSSTLPGTAILPEIARAIGVAAPAPGRTRVPGLAQVGTRKET